MLSKAADLPEAGEAFIYYMNAMFGLDPEQREELGLTCVDDLWDSGGLPGGPGRRAPGPEYSTGVLKGNSCDPQVKTPAPGLLTGSHPKVRRHTGSPPPLSHPGHPQRITNSCCHAAAAPARRDPHRPGFSRDATIPPDVLACYNTIRQPAHPR